MPTEENIPLKPATPPLEPASAMNAVRGAGYGLLKATPFFVSLIAVLNALGQIASSIYVPSFPALAAELSVSMGAVQVTLVAFLGVFAVGQLLCGTISDRFGRKPVLLLGILVYIMGSLVCAVATGIEILLVGRMIQALGAATGLVIGRAVIRDVFAGVELTKVMALVTIIFALAPGLSVLLGGFLQDTFGWESTFYVIAFLGIIVLLLVNLKLPETNLKPMEHLDFVGVFQAYGSVFASRSFTIFSFVSTLLYGALMAFMVGSPHLYINIIGISPTEFGFYPPIAITGFIIGGIATRRLIHEDNEHRVVLFALILSSVAVAFMVGLPLLGLLHKHAMTASMVLFVTGFGIFMPTAVAAAIRDFPQKAGTAAAMMGCLQMAGGAVAALVVSAIQAQFPVLSFPLVMFFCTAAAFVLFALTTRFQKI